MSRDRLPDPTAVSPPLGLDADDVHVWQVSLEAAPEVLQRFTETLSEDETARAKRFHFERDRSSFIAARGALRALLGRYLATAPAQLSFKYGPQGKPELDPETDLAFNLSHSATTALIGLARGEPIGIDLEQVQAFDVVQDLPEAIFSPRELAEFSALPATELPMAFFAAWTRKEAVVKALGLGFSMPVREVEVTFASGAPVTLVRLEGDSTLAACWTLMDLPAPPGFRAALARPGSVRRVLWQA
ncbi:MAG: 4'-phosphopantetheinyl transferase superfamily protein [Chloroflexota bacterium]|nr:4'-phosphopantetheinyl transferase superfamily protein [Chloroflexota bacterium]